MADVVQRPVLTLVKREEPEVNQELEGKRWQVYSLPHQDWHFSCAEDHGVCFVIHYSKWIYKYICLWVCLYVVILKNSKKKKKLLFVVNRELYRQYTKSDLLLNSNFI